jgi:flagellar basal-body rod protein FlgB
MALTTLRAANRQVARWLECLERAQSTSAMINDKTRLLSNDMATYARRMDAISGNIANLDTPGYRKISVSFEDRLQEVLHGVDGGRGASDIKPTLELGEQPPVLEDELMEMADTQMRNQLTTRALSEHFGMIRTGITGRTG